MVKLINLNFEKFGWEQVFFIKSAHAIFFFVIIGYGAGKGDLLLTSNTY